jgi:hypothetical protein
MIARVLPAGSPEVFNLAWRGAAGGRNETGEVRSQNNWIKTGS